MNVIHHDTKTKNAEITIAQLSYKNFQICMTIGIALIIIMSFIYLIFLNSIATRGFSLEKIKANRLSITKELEQVEINLAIPLSLYALQSSSQVQNMATIEEKDYLHIKNGQLAMK